jgi:hypothetical protein
MPEDDIPAWNRPAELLTQAASLAVLHGVYIAQDAADYSRWALSAAGAGWDGEQDEEKIQCELLRDLVGPLLFRGVVIDPFWRAANDAAAVDLALGIYEEEAFDRLPILADALEEAGCSDFAVLDHCRGLYQHVRGCWVVDLILDRE